MKPLLPLTSPSYKRRLIREINIRLRNGETVYLDISPRSTHPIKVTFVTYGHVTNKIIVTDTDNKTVDTADEGTFWDGYGNQIVASRVT